MKQKNGNKIKKEQNKKEKIIFRLELPTPWVESYSVNADMSENWYFTDYRGGKKEVYKIRTDREGYPYIVMKGTKFDLGEIKEFIDFSIPAEIDKELEKKFGGDNYEGVDGFRYPDDEDWEQIIRNSSLSRKKEYPLVWTYFQIETTKDKEKETIEAVKKICQDKKYYVDVREIVSLKRGE